MSPNAGSASSRASLATGRLQGAGNPRGGPAQAQPNQPQQQTGQAWQPGQNGGSCSRRYAAVGARVSNRPVPLRLTYKGTDNLES